MNTPHTDYTDESTQNSAIETEEDAEKTKVAPVQKQSYSKLTTFIYKKLLLGEQFVSSFKHNSGLKHQHSSHKKEKRKTEHRTYRTPNRILYKTSARTFGFFFTSFGLFLLLLCLFGTKLFHTADWPISSHVSAIFSLLLGLALIPFGMPISSFLSGSHLISFLLCDLLLMKKLRMAEEPFNRRTSRLLSFCAFLFGTALAFLSIFVSPLWILGILLLLAFVCSAFAAPECCLVIAALLLPWLSLFDHPSTILGALTFLLTVTFFCKVLRHKRTFTFTLPDALVLILAGLYMLGGAHALGSGFYRSHGALFALLICVYFPVSNLLRDRRILYHTIAALLTSGVASAILGIFQWATTSSYANTLDKNALGYIPSRASAFFNDGPNIFAMYLVLLLPLCFYLFTAAKKMYSRFFAILPLGLMVAALFFTASRGAWLGFICAFLLFTVLAFRQKPTVLLALFAAVPLILLLLPDWIILRFDSIFNWSDTSIVYRLSTWKGAWNLFTDHIFAGVGAGTISFTHAYPMYALPGTEGIAHAHNLFLEMGIELGVFAPVIFLLLIVALTAVTFTRPICRGKHDLRILQISCYAALCGILTQGMTDYIFYNSRIVFLFFLLVGMTVACARCQAEDHVRNIDFSAGTQESASTDIRFKK